MITFKGEIKVNVVNDINLYLFNQNCCGLFELSEDPHSFREVLVIGAEELPH